MMRPNSVIQALLLVLLAWPAMAQPPAAVAPGAYRTAAQPVLARPDGALLLEAEEFQVTQPGWQTKRWGENYYAATFAITFLSRKAFLGAPEQGASVATQAITVPEAGKWLVLARYEAPYRFETQFRVKVEQAGKIVLDRLYGARANLKIWPFHRKLQTEVAWGWGAVENFVWEGHDAAVELAAGPATVSLIATEQPAPAARRQVDCLLLTRDEADIRLRIEKERYLPLDGLLTQAGDVWLRVANTGRSALTLKVAPGTEHSPYWVHTRRWQPVNIPVGLGQTSEWTEVGSLLDSLNDGQWALLAEPSDRDLQLSYTVEVALKDAAGELQPLAKFTSDRPRLPLVYHADTRYSRLVRHQRQVLFDLLATLKAETPPGRLPVRTGIWGYTFAEEAGDPEYNAAIMEFAGLFGLNHGRDGGTGPRGYIDVRGLRLEDLKAYLGKLGPRAQEITVVSLGDEIGLASPLATAADEGLRAYLKEQGMRPEDLVAGAGDDWNKVSYSVAQATATEAPKRYYWSRRYQQEYGIAQLKERTDLLRQHLPNAGIGANFSPHHGSAHAYLGEVNQWVLTFRRGGMTMPWSEDYIWQLPVGTPQMNMLNLDLFRAGLRGRPEARIHYYVMPHWPGNTPRMWRRQFYGDLAHGMKEVNLFEFRPVQAAYTENHVSLPAMYQEVRRAFHELGAMDDLVQDGQVRAGQVGLWFSATSDIWGDTAGSFAAAKRALYIALQHQQVAVDVLVDEDTPATLASYRVIALTDRHVTRAASQKLADWVAAGGTLISTAGAGMRDEYDEPNSILPALLGITETALEAPEAAQIAYIKQDLPFAEPLSQVNWQTPYQLAPQPVYGVRGQVTVTDAKVIGEFTDKRPAMTTRQVGKGQAIHLAWLPGLSYFAPAIPKRPVDRGSTDDAMAHFIPTAFHGTTQAMLRSFLPDDLARPVTCSEALVAAKIIDAPRGWLIPLVNWSAAPRTGLKVTLALGATPKSITLASGAPVQVQPTATGLELTLDLDVADALILLR